ncbi:MAG: LytR/AlgR family response regulator transcription factor [Thalassotalea sp.]
MSLSVLIVEDEAPAREKLSHQLSLLADIELLGFAEDGKKAIKQINQLKPELIFLDVDMPEINGIDVLSLLTHQPMVIFTTAYDKYALQAFENRALDYLLKPYSLARLQEAVKRAQEKHQSTNNNIPVATSAEALKSKKIVSYVGERMYMLNPDEIYLFKAEQGTTLAVNEQKSWPIKESLEQLEQRLPIQQFVRVHRSYLVNIDYIKEMQRWFNGKLMLIINDNNRTEISTSRAGAERIKQLLK